MDDKQKLAEETAAYLAKIRKTINQSRDLVESAKLRMDETDRMLASQGLTREDVRKMTYTPEQVRAVNEELVRRGLKPIEDDVADVRSEYGEHSLGSGNAEAPFRPSASDASANFTAGDGDGSTENRKRKFNVMMQQFRM